MAELGIDGDVRRRITGHQAQDVHGRVYDQADRQNAVREALLNVEEHVSAAADSVGHAKVKSLAAKLVKAECS